jgi:hypothetical protein
MARGLAPTASVFSRHVIANVRSRRVEREGVIVQYPALAYTLG